MDQIKQSRNEQTVILDDIEKGIDVLTNHANNIKDELELQSKIIDDISSKMNKDSNKISETNNSLANLLRKYPNCYCYIVCTFLLIIIGIILYFLIKK